MGKKDNKKKKGGQNRSDDDEAMLNASHQASRATEHRSSGHDGHESDDDESADGSLPLCFDPGYPKRLLEKMDPSVRDRIYALRALQDKYVTEAYDQYVEEMCTLEKRYEAIFAPLYARRAALIKGEALPTSEEVEKGTPDDETTAKRLQDGGDAQEGENSKDGIRDFWLHALKRNKMTAKLIMEHDEPALRSLIDIRCVLHDDAKDGFTLLFFFDPTQNSAFENTCLTKRIDVTRSNGSVMVGKTTGTEIQWKPHQNLTVEEKSKKQRSKKTKQIRYVTVTEPRPSFFRYFQSNTAQNPFSDSQARMGDDDDDEEEEEEDEEFENSAETDHEVALEIKDKIIPKAVEFFTGEVQTDDDDDEDDDFEDEEEEEDEEEDEDEEEEDTYDQRRGGGNRSRQQGRGNRGAQQGGGKGVSKEQAECKQQ